jgi:hypothetical protein
VPREIAAAIPARTILGKRADRFCAASRASRARACAWLDDLAAWLRIRSRPSAVVLVVPRASNSKRWGSARDPHRRLVLGGRHKAPALSARAMVLPHAVPSGKSGAVNLIRGTSFRKATLDRSRQHHVCADLFRLRAMQVSFKAGILAWVILCHLAQQNLP